MELGGLQKCILNMASKKLKVVNIVQVMLILRILPCQQWLLNLWEFDLAQHQTLSEHFDTTHKDVWKVMFKGAEVPPFSYRGPRAKREAPCESGKFCTSGRVFIFHSLTMCGI